MTNQRIELTLPHNNPRHNHVTSWGDATVNEPRRDLVYCKCGEQVCDTNRRLNDQYTACEKCRGKK